MTSVTRAAAACALGVIAAATALGGCAGHQDPPPAGRPTGGTSTSASVAGDHDDDTGGGVSLPATFPTTVPLPAESVVGTGTGPGRWSLVLSISGSAPGVLRDVVHFYASRGFTADSPSRLHGHGYRIDLAVENDDHSDARTNLTLVVHR